MWSKIWTGFITGLSICGFIVILIFPYVKEDPVANRCLSLYILTVGLYVSNIVPYFVVSMLVPLFVILMRVMKNSDGTLMNAQESASAIIGSMFDSIPLTIMGSLAISLAMRRFKVFKTLGIESLLKKIDNAAVFVLVLMFLTLFGSLFMFNSSSAFLLFNLVLDWLLIYEHDSNEAKGILLGLIVAGNVGGMTLPISSPQSNYAYFEVRHHTENLYWKWFATTLPITIITIIFSWFHICLSFGLFTKSIQKITEKNCDDDLDGEDIKNFKFKQFIVISTCLVTFLGWSLMPLIRPYIGSMATISLIPLIVFFGLDILNEKHLGKLQWDIVFLSLGGIGLNEAVRSSNLISTFGRETERILNFGNLIVKMLVITMLITLSAIFKSRFVTSLIILPVLIAFLEGAKGVAQSNERLILYILSAFSCSAGLALPSSGLVNMALSVSMDRNGKKYLSTLEFIKICLPATFLMYILINSLGYVILRYGFYKQV